MTPNLLTAGVVAVSLTAAASAAAQTPAERPQQAPPGAVQMENPRNPAEQSAPAVPPRASTLKGMAAEGLKGQTVYNRRAEEVATIEGVGEDAARGRVAVLEVGGFFGIGAKSVAVPLERLEVGSDGRLVMDTTVDELKSRPEFQGKLTGDTRS